MALNGLPTAGSAPPVGQGAHIDFMIAAPIAAVPTKPVTIARRGPRAFLGFPRSITTAYAYHALLQAA